MKHLLTLLLTLLFLNAIKGQTKSEYLSQNRFDLNKKSFTFPQNDFKIIGFGAYHGSAKTEEVELDLIQALLKSGTIKYYLPETDFSIAHYFNRFLENGDTVLLKDLVTLYGIRVPQERTIEVYEKWKQLKKINDQLKKENKLKVIGIDIQVNYKYTAKHLLELIHDPEKTLSPVEDIRKMVLTDTTDFSLGNLSYAHQLMKALINEYETHPAKYNLAISNKPAFQHILKNLKIAQDFSYKKREQTIYENYVDLSSVYNFNQHPQFLRFGFSHIEKSREGVKGYPYFFTRLIENKRYKKEEVLTVIGYLTNSKVVWDEKFDEEGNYSGYTTEAGFGIGDYEKEYFRGIQHLKTSKISDKTLFRLNLPSTPYSNKEPDLIEVVMTDEKSNGDAVKGMSTTDFMDYAILISNSRASIPIFEMK